MAEEEQESIQKLEGSHEQLENDSVHQSRQLMPALNHSSEEGHEQIAANDSFRSAFPFWQRVGAYLFNCCCCRPRDQSFVTHLQEMQKKSQANLSEEVKKDMQGKIVKIKIVETSRLELDPNVMHPIVKVHVVHKDTGCYLPRDMSHENEQVVYHTQQLTSYNKVEKKFIPHHNDLILPFATNLCDFRKRGSARGSWNQSFYINHPAQYFFRSETLILFEILDFNHSALLYRNKEDSFDRNNMCRVAWAYLRPVGVSSRIHRGQFQLQLHRYKFNPSDEWKGEPFIPQVYYDFLWNNHQQYPGTLTVKLNFCPRQKSLYAKEGEFPKSLFDEEKEDNTFWERFEKEQAQVVQEESAKVAPQLMRFLRNRDLCEIPRELIYKLQSADLGCFRVRFLGNYLLGALSGRRYSQIGVWELGKGEKMMSLKGHRGVVYDMQVSPQQRVLVTSGSDHMVRVYVLPDETREFIDEEESEDLIIGECIHTAAVYSVGVTVQRLQEVVQVITCCYDGAVRLWEVGLKNKKEDRRVEKTKEIMIGQELGGKIFPTCCSVFENSFVVVGDSVGQIRIFDYGRDKFNLRCRIVPEELKDDKILSVRILQKSHLMIMASDNLIRHYQLIGNRLRLHQTYSGAMFEKELAQCSVSPDHKYLLAPSESGRPALWDVFTGSQVSLDHLNLTLDGHLTTCDWHPTYNLVAISGFVPHCPVFVFGNILSPNQIPLIAAQQTK